MKTFLIKISPYVFALAFVALLFACIRKEEPKKDDFLSVPKTEEVKPEPRIKYVDSESISGHTVTIIEVDGHLYMTSYTGGFIHLESCPCKKKL